MSEQRLLIRNGFVVSMDQEIGELAAADVLVEEGKIATIVVFADTSNVDSVFVAGRAVKRGGRSSASTSIAPFIQLDESRNSILSNGGLLPDWADPAAAAA